MQLYSPTKFSFSALVTVCCISIPSLADISCTPPVIPSASVCVDSSSFDAADVSNLLDCALMLRDQKRFSEALAVLTEALVLSPENSVLFARRGNVYRRNGDYTCARRDYTEAIRIEPQNARYFSGRAIVHYFQKSHPEVIADLNKSIEIDPDDSISYLLRANSFEELDQLEAARSDVKRYLRDFPDNDLAKRLLNRVERNLDLRQGLRCAIDPELCG